MHALFHIRTVIIPRDDNYPEMEKGMQNYLFITYFNIELKRTKLTSHTDTKLMDMSDRYRLRDDYSPVMH
jgi:hypothetical protein